jgi:hypothetical protein
MSLITEFIAQNIKIKVKKLFSDDRVFKHCDLNRYREHSDITTGSPGLGAK